MAEQLHFMAMSHGPQLMVKPDQWNVLHDRYGDSIPVRPELEKETIDVKWAKWERCMKAIVALRETLRAWAPEALVIVADDQHENLVDDAMPPFTIYMGQEAPASVSLNYFNEPKSENRTTYKVHASLATSLVNDLMDQGFDPAYSKTLRYDGGLGHAFARPLKFLTPDAEIPVVPVMVNTYYPPAPSAKRCVEFGRALAVAIRRVKGAGRVAVLGSGGLSHTLIDEELDGKVLRAIEKNDLDALGALPSSVLVSGTSEIRNWVVTAAAADRPATIVDYVPCYRTSRGVGCAMGFAYWKG
jgi:aromatic ring-opening dioxygenase catalytic subunit (LigB family)